MAGQCPRELAAEVSSLRKLKPNLGKAVAHLSLSADIKDRVLTDDDWRQAITTALAAHGAQDAPFACYRHHDTAHQHAHVFTFESHQMAAWSVIRIHTVKMKSLPELLKESLTLTHQPPFHAAGS